MLQHLDRSREEELLGAIRTVSEERAEEVRELMFTFEDLAQLPDEALQLILRSVSLNNLAVALRGAPAALMNKITRNLSSNAKENLQEEIDLLGKVKLSVVEAEQRNIVHIVHDLAEKGEIDYRGSSQEEVYV
jgi:flagellar motor switch protein FliG